MGARPTSLTAISSPNKKPLAAPNKKPQMGLLANFFHLYQISTINNVELVAGAGFEPTTFGL
jgi:hypothetical protein